MTGTGLGKDKEDIVHPQSYQVLQLEECQLLALCPWARLTTAAEDKRVGCLGIWGPWRNTSPSVPAGQGLPPSIRGHPISY